MGSPIEIHIINTATSMLELFTRYTHKILTYKDVGTSLLVQNPTRMNRLQAFRSGSRIDDKQMRVTHT